MSKIIDFFFSLGGSRDVVIYAFLFPCLCTLYRQISSPTIKHLYNILVSLSIIVYMYESLAYLCIFVPVLGTYLLMYAMPMRHMLKSVLIFNSVSHEL
jgi:hypothetical protein